MGLLNIVFNEGGPNLENAAVPGEVIGSNLAPVWDGNFHMGKISAVNCPPGPYLVRAFLPSGEVVTQQVLAKQDEDVSVFLGPAGPSPRETLLRSMVFQGFSRWPQVGPEVARLSVEADRSDSGWIRFWHHSGSNWMEERLPVIGQPDTNLQHPGPNVLTSAELDIPLGCYWMQLGGEACPWKLVALPGQGRVQIVVTQDALPNPAARSDPVHVIISSGRPEAEAMLGFLTRGDVERARGLVRAADWMLEEKIADPFSAAIGGYFLLLAGELDRLETRSSNLAEWFPWLADGSVIAGWHMLRRSDESLPEARKYFLRAAEIGPPMFGYGLKLLVDGLTYFAEAQAEAGEHDAEALRALDAVREFYGARVKSPAATSYYGPHPAQPSRQRRLGRRDDAEPPPLEFGARRDKPVPAGVGG